MSTKRIAGVRMMQAEQITPTAYRVTECAQYLAVSERKVWDLIKQNDIPVIRFGGITRILKDDVDAFIEKCRGNG